MLQMERIPHHLRTRRTGECLGDSPSPILSSLDRLSIKLRKYDVRMQSMTASHPFHRFRFAASLDDLHRHLYYIPLTTLQSGFTGRLTSSFLYLPR